MGFSRDARTLSTARLYCVPVPPKLLAACAGFAVVATLGSVARADGVAVLTDPSVAPYAETVAALRSSATGLTFVEFDVHRADAVTAMLATSPQVIVAVGQ